MDSSNSGGGRTGAGVGAVGAVGAAGAATVAGGPSGSSDFVRKLYKMLEDPTHKTVVRWNESGDSFIVVDYEKTNEFTKNILPRHFKHSNFASFVRQLNKYDFHKIRNNDEGGASHGEQSWEFKHPDFQMHNKDNLDNIRRKAPAPRKQQQPHEDTSSQQIEELQNEVREMAALQNQTNAQMQRLNTHNNAIIHELHTMQSVLQTQEAQLQTQQAQIVTHEQVMKKLISVLWRYDEEIRGLRHPGSTRLGDARREGSQSEGVSPENGNAQSGTPGTSPNAHINDGPATPLQQAQRLMNSYSEISKSTTPLPHPTDNNQASPPEPGAVDNFGGPARHPQNGQQSNAVQNGLQPMNQSGAAAYGMNQATVGDFYNNSHAKNMGFPMAPPQTEATPAGRPNKRSGFLPSWTKSPRVLLVEDDPTCARIGSKFLQNAQCGVDQANDGLIAVTKMSESGNKYDLVLMDIVMPNLDGVSASSLIRQFDKETPIIAMTSNIRRDDINLYFSSGMNDVLPKPFTKEGLLIMLEKMLVHLKANRGQVPPQLGFAGGAENRIMEEQQNGASVKSTNSVKFSQSPSSKSPQNCGGVYGSARSSTDLGDEHTGDTPSAVDEGGYMHMMGGYIDSNGNTHDHGSSFSSPANSARGIRRSASEMDDPQHHMGSVEVKKPRY